MNLYLVRHTRTALPPGICYGVSDVALAAPADINEIVYKLKHLDNPIVYSSPLMRCKLLAQKLSSHVIIDNRLKELNFGHWELLAWNDIKGHEADAWMNDFVNVRCPGGESYIDLAQRVTLFLSDLAKSGHVTAVIVTHAGVLRAILAQIQRIPLHKSFETEIGYGEIMSLTV
jgi:alpha-ribazole phosphatase